MTLLPSSPARLLPVLLVLAPFGITWPTGAEAPIERRLERRFSVDGRSVVSVRITGGPIQVTTGPDGTAEVRLVQRIDVPTDAEADEQLKNYEISLAENGGQISLLARRLSGSSWSWRARDRVRLAAELVVPPNVRLDLDTSGGSITVRGDRTAPLDADTSGGAIFVDGGRGEMMLDTSGGSIEVRRALSALRADTSGGHISVEYVGPEVRDVRLDTSGGGIEVGVDPDAKLSIEARTSGGSVRMEGLSLSTTGTLSRSRVEGNLNAGGGGRLVAGTSGGSIIVRAARR